MSAPTPREAQAPLEAMFGRDGYLLEAWIDLHGETGRVVPSPELDRATRARVRLVLLALRLNDGRLRQARRRLLRALLHAWSIGDLLSVKEMVAQGPHRLVARRFLASKRPLGAAGE